jgi:hypothetical protein
MRIRVTVTVITLRLMLTQQLQSEIDGTVLHCNDVRLLDAPRSNGPVLGSSSLAPFMLPVSECLHLPPLVHGNVGTEVCLIHTHNQHFLTQQLCHNARQPDTTLVEQWVSVPCHCSIVLEEPQLELLFQNQTHSFGARHFQIRNVRRYYEVSYTLYSQSMQSIALDALTDHIDKLLILQSRLGAALVWHWINDVHDLGLQLLKWNLVCLLQ